ncbi:MAG TPA: hypothetical protein VN663_22915 [Ramlibacter sp.]|nr:hypothetical protein [Ramlibacter sp.]
MMLRLALTLAICLALGGGSADAWLIGGSGVPQKFVLGPHIASQGFQNTTTPAIDTSGYGLIVLGIAYNANGGFPTLSDSKSNTWLNASSGLIGLYEYGELWYCSPCTVGASHTFSITATTLAAPAIVAAAFSGVKTSSPYDQHNSNAAASVNTLTTGSVTPTENSELVVHMVGVYASAPTTNVGAIVDQIAVTCPAGCKYGVALAYEAQTTATTRNATWNNGITNDLATGIATFKAAP